jgi:TonB family protein
MGRDAAFLAAAFLLHFPLTLIHWDAPRRHRGESRLVNIDYIEKVAEKRNVAPVLAPKLSLPKILPTVKKIKDLKTRFVPPPPPAVTPKKIEALVLAPSAHKIVNTSSRAPVPDPAKILAGKSGFQGNRLHAGRTEIKLAAAGSSLSAPAGRGVPGPAGGNTLRGKSGFQVSAGALPASIGGEDSLKTDGAVLALPVGKGGRAEAAVLSPHAVLTPKKSFSPGPGAPSGGGASPHLAGGTGSGGSIALGRAPSADAGTAPLLKNEKSFSPAGTGSRRTAAPGNPAAFPSASLVPAAAARRPAFQITGPLAKRKVLTRVIPEFPEWARAKGINAAVTLRFTVSPEGDVRGDIVILRSTTYSALDDAAIGALRGWKFVPLSMDQNRNEVGDITMTFTVR